MRSVLSLALAACALCPGAAVSQSWTFGAGAAVQGYSFAEPDQVGASRIALWTAPVGVSGPVGRWVSVALLAQASDAVVTRSDGGLDGIATMTDVQWSVIGQSADRGFMLRLSGAVPVSGTTRSIPDAVIAGMTGSALLPFITNRWPAGLHVGADLGLRRRLGPVALEAEGGIRKQQGDVRIADEELGYRPGDELRGRVTLEVEAGQASLFAVTLGVQHFTPDAAEGLDLYHAGTRREGLVSYAFPLSLVGSGVVFVTVRDFARGVLSNHAPPNTGLVKLRAILPGLKNAPRRQIVAGGASLRIIGARVTLFPDVELRMARAVVPECAASAQPSTDRRCLVNQAWTFSTGLAADLTLGARADRMRLVVTPAGHVRLGRIGAHGGTQSQVFGWDAGLAMRLQGRP